MKNTKIAILIMLLGILIVSPCLQYVVADAGDGFDASVVPNMSTIDSNVKKAGNKISGTVFTILQIAAFAGIIFCGIKYMYSSAEQKADIKSSMFALCTGMVLVFGASTLAKYAQRSADQLYKPGSSLDEGKTVAINGVSYKYTDYNTGETCHSETINKKVMINAQYAYCTASGACCKLVNGQMEYTTDWTAASDENIKNQESKKNVKVTAKLPGSVFTRTQCGQNSYYYSPSGSKQEIVMYVEVYSDNTGKVNQIVSGKPKDSDGNTANLSYSVKDGKIYVNVQDQQSSACSPGMQLNYQLELVSPSSLKYKKL